VALVNQDIELRWAVTSVVLIIEIHPKPRTPLAVEDVNGSAVWRVIMDQKDHQGSWKLEPPNDVRVLSKLQQSGNRFLQCL
jgi:hypothetical protein